MRRLLKGTNYGRGSRGRTSTLSAEASRVPTYGGTDVFPDNDVWPDRAAESFRANAVSASGKGLRRN